MATTLKAVIAFTGVASGATVALPHTLNVGGTGAIPDKTGVDNSSFEVLDADATDVTIRNNSGDAADVGVLVEHFHTFDRVFGASSVKALTPQPFKTVAPIIDSPTYVYPESLVTRYVRSATGDDDNDGLSVATAWATLNKGLGFLAGFSTNRSKTLDVSDSAFSDNEQLNFPALFGGQNGDLDFGASGPDNFFFKTIGQIRASQSLQQALTITGIVPDTVTGQPVISVSEVLVPNAHIGQLIIGSGLAEYGVCVENDAGTLTVAATGTTFTAPVGAYVPSTTFTFGEAGNFFQQATYINMFANMTVQGISFLANDAAQSALTIFSSMPYNLQLCQIQGLNLEGGAGQGVMDACYVTRRFLQNNASIERRSSFFDTCDIDSHGDGGSGLNNINGCYFDSCQPVLSGNFESRVGCQIQNTEIANSTAQGVIMRGSNINRIVDTRIRDSAADAVLVDVPMRLRLDNVVGTGNVGHGVLMQNGAQVEVAGTVPSVTGTTGDISLGGNGTTTWAAARPATDVGAGAPEFCRLF